MEFGARTKMTIPPRRTGAKGCPQTISLGRAGVVLEPQTVSLCSYAVPIFPSQHDLPWPHAGESRTRPAECMCPSPPGLPRVLRATFDNREAVEFHSPGSAAHPGVRVSVPCEPRSGSTSSAPSAAPFSPGADANPYGKERRIAAITVSSLTYHGRRGRTIRVPVCRTASRIITPRFNA